MNIITRTYRIKEWNTQKNIIVDSNLFAFDIVKKYFPDITHEKTLSPYTMRFFSPSHGDIYASWDWNI